MSRQDPARQFLGTIWQALQGDPAVLTHVELSGQGDLPSVYCVSDLASAAVGAAAASLVELLGQTGAPPAALVGRRLAGLWFGGSVKPEGWTLAGPWDPIAGDYATGDGWIRLHTNAPHHRAAALAVLEVPPEKARVQSVVAGWPGEALETAVVARGGCAAAMHSKDAWLRHPQGMRVREEPLLALRDTEDRDSLHWQPGRERPLAGLRVLDLTRVLAGPVATRFLAGFGAEVLRIDPPHWDEPAIVPDVTLGKRCARLDFKDRADREQLERLLAEAHVLVHGYRADALEALGLGVESRRRIRPGLVDVCLNAYGWSGPWRNRRGFDSLVQMSCGIAEAGMQLLKKGRPTPLPVQALDHATGYLIAAAIVRGLTQRLASGRGFEARASLARTAELLMAGPAGPSDAAFAPAGLQEWSAGLEATDFGPAHRLKPPVELSGCAMRWDRPASSLGRSAPEW